MQSRSSSRPSPRRHEELTDKRDDSKPAGPRPGDDPTPAELVEDRPQLSFWCPPCQAFEFGTRDPVPPVSSVPTPARSLDAGSPLGLLVQPGPADRIQNLARDAL